MPDRPQIELTTENTWCPVHLEPFRAEWPKGYVLAMPLMFTAFVGLADVQRYCGLDDEGNLGDAAKLNAALAEFGPICCAIDITTRVEITDAVLGDDADRVKALNDRLVARNKERP